jgi:hypothetical protein
VTCTRTATSLSGRKVTEEEEEELDGLSYFFRVLFFF